MRKNRSGGHTHIWVEHLQACLRESYPVKDSASPPNTIFWLKLVDLIQFMW